ncbi:hypothetical protein GCM10011611_58540 [Aliidongia dinghuensis]|uniref:Uncharacterized protein n=1 Tax=Aliidongia dinghuensis TaxID=1867774 RepID=A0A8J2Z0F6_9PROT|nr:hypothetical protein [Aliidongia dinghuensis]GGF44411.1 hypothetical protein GCM10011611_58540 [Aliidongia dinghuensis]
MRTPKLLIIAIRGVHGTAEVDLGANGIYTKYSNRKDINKEVQLIYMSRSGSIVSGIGVGDMTIEEGDRLGIYIVAHSGDLNTAIFDGHDLVSSFKTKILDQKSGDVQYNLDKICLVVCTSASNAKEILSDSAEGVMIARFAKLLVNVGLTPRLAGWTKFVTVDESGKKKILHNTNFSQIYASEWPKTNATQKMVYVWDGDKGYVKKELADWTDK